MVDCYTCDFTVACARRIKKKKMKALQMSPSAKGLYEKVQSFLSAKKKKKELYQSFFRSLPHNRCSGLIPSIQKTVSPL